MASVLACPTAEIEWVPTDMTKDGAGNILTKTSETPASGGTVVTETRTYNNLNQLTQNVVNTVTQSPYSNTTVTWTFTWDASGNMHTRSDGTNTTTYTWDEDNRLTQVSLPGGASVSYTYSQDIIGRMLSRTDINGTALFVWDRADCVQETDYQGNVTRYYLPDGQLLGFDRQGISYQIHADAVASVRKVTDPNGSVVATYDFDAWGSPLASTADSIPGGLQYRFVGALGMRWDATTGLYYARARWYDPSLGRFISRDQRKKDNRYIYSLNNPLRYIDANGLDATAPDKQTLHKQQQIYKDLHPGARECAPEDPGYNCVNFAFNFSGLTNAPPGNWNPNQSMLGQLSGPGGPLEQVDYPRPGDIVTYEPYGQFKHIAVVTCVAGRDITVEGKIGDLGVFESGLTDLSPTYLEGGHFSGRFFRVKGHRGANGQPGIPRSHCGCPQ
jgi:RHS repeat-associated protein